MNPPQVNVSGKSSGRDKLIFVVDDEPMLLELASVILEPAGYEVKTYRDGESALQAFKAADPKPILVITDYAMHSMTGLVLIESCRRLRPGQKVLLISGTVDERVYLDAPSKPDEFLPKPYTAGQLLESVRTLIKAAQSS